jgi:hypothetical protein
MKWGQLSYYPIFKENTITINIGTFNFHVSFHRSFQAANIYQLHNDCNNIAKEAIHHMKMSRRNICLSL